ERPSGRLQADGGSVQPYTAVSRFGPAAHTPSAPLRCRRALDSVGKAFHCFEKKGCSSRNRENVRQKQRDPGRDAQKNVQTRAPWKREHAGQSSASATARKE